MKGWFLHIDDLFRQVWRLRPHLRGGRRLLGAVFGSSMLTALLEGAGVGLLVPLLSLLLERGGAAPMRPIRWAGEWLPNHSHEFYVMLFCGAVFGCILVKNLVFYLSQVLAARLRRRITVNLRNSLFQRLQGADIHLFEQRGAGEIANLFMGETTRFLSALDHSILLVQRLAMALFYFVMLLFISWQLTGITVALAAVIAASVAFLHRRLSRSGREISTLNGRISGFLVEIFGGIRVIRATNSQEREMDRFQSLNESQADIEERSIRTRSLLHPIAESVAVAGAMLIVGLAYIALVRPGLMLPSYLLGFGFILLRLLPLLNQVHGLHGQVLYAAGSFLEVNRLLLSPQYPVRSFGAIEFAGVKREIEIRRVGYRYPDGTRVLNAIDLRVPAGATVALVGESGSGKSTLASLLLRLRQPTDGAILVDGVDYWEFSSDSWHRSVAVVEQDAFLFHDTLARNIGYGFPEVTMAQIEEAVRISHLHDVVDALPEGLNTLIGERGTRLSGGQRQRLALARALVRNPRFLILDEATSALDTVSEREIQAALETALTGRTVLVIAHRLSTIRDADHIAVLDAGRIVEQGTWDSLTRAGGKFARLVAGAAGGPVLVKK